MNKNRAQEQELIQKAVALKYDQEKGRAPLVVAKGMGEIAEHIIQLAEENDIHIHESPELVEVLVRLELGDEIPEALYRAIAEVIAFAYSLKQIDITGPTGKKRGQ